MSHASNHRIALIGLRGSGKSSVGRELARRLSIEAFDTDQRIADRTGRSPGEFISAEGEPAFRAIEAEVVLDTLTRSEGVVALGGGAILAESVRDALDAWSVVWLDAPDSVLLERCRGDERDALSDESLPDPSRPETAATVRPPLTSLSAEEEIAELRRQRAPLYQRLAGLSFDTSVRSVHDVAESILKQRPSA